MNSAVYFLLLMLPLISAQITRWGPCPTPRLQPNFNLERYLGKWYEIEKIPTFFAQGKCDEVNYSLRNNDTIKVVNSQMFQGNYRYIEGTAVIQNTRQPAKLGISFSNFTPYSTYWIVSTDYTSVAIVYSCTDILHLFNYQYVWIYGRSRSLPAMKINNAKKMLRKEGINVSKMKRTDQNCNTDQADRVAFC
ncbi:apolipoprotein D-like [Melanotaenia boesemani]|uniref:apolipoprotein D-like n=1 Tax=Melanotaenia boesemani TaxID=1250792 RepID=UPI001C041275|nr:apolipoprotein D-like [Melanotaenia boesemani]